jgi:hypothetical protein
VTLLQKTTEHVYYQYYSSHASPTVRFRAVVFLQEGNIVF